MWNRLVVSSLTRIPHISDQHTKLVLNFVAGNDYMVRRFHQFGNYDCRDRKSSMEELQTKKRIGEGANWSRGVSTDNSKRERGTNVFLLNRKKAHHSIFIHGFCGEGEKNAKAISQQIYGQRPSKAVEATMVQAISNPADLPCRVDDAVVSRVQKYLLAPSMLEKGTEEILLTIFCHSNGAKVVRHVLSPENLEKVLSKEQLQSSVPDTIENIRNQLAVVSFGGVSLIPDHYAEVVLNFVAEEDVLAKWCHFLGIGDYQDQTKNTFFRNPDNPEEKEQIEILPVSLLRRLLSAPENAYFLSHALWPPWESIVLYLLLKLKRNQHSIGKYLEHRKMVEFIQHKIISRESGDMQ